MTYEYIKRIMRFPPPTGCEWDDQTNVVKNFKRRYKRFLRVAQRGVCCYCLRPLGDDGDVDLEHILEKSIAPQLAFTMENLALSCRSCNNKKEATRKKINSFFSRKIKKNHIIRPGEKIETGILPWLLTRHIGYLELKKQPYRRFHPHFHKYSEHIELTSGFIYRYKTKIGRRTGNALDLNKLAAIESRRIREQGGIVNKIENLIKMNNLTQAQKAALIKKLSN